MKFNIVQKIKYFGSGLQGQLDFDEHRKAFLTSLLGYLMVSGLCPSSFYGDKNGLTFGRIIALTQIGYGNAKIHNNFLKLVLKMCSDEKYTSMADVMNHVKKLYIYFRPDGFSKGK